MSAMVSRSSSSHLTIYTINQDKTNKLRISSVAVTSFIYK